MASIIIEELADYVAQAEREFYCNSERALAESCIALAMSDFIDNDSNSAYKSLKRLGVFN